MVKRSLFPFKIDRWDSNFFKTVIARHTISKKEELAHFLSGMPDFIEQAKIKKVGHIVIKLEGSAVFYEKELLRLGMKKCGESVDSKFSYAGKKEKDLFSGNGIDIFKPGDIKGIKYIASDAFRRSYFYECGFAGKSVIDRYHAVWIENLSKDKDSRIFVSRYNGGITGFIGLKFDRGKRRGRIILIAVHKKYRGKGIGCALIRKCISWSKGRVSAIFVKTQKTNRDALTLYKKMGFKITNRDKILHKKI